MAGAVEDCGCGGQLKGQEISGPNSDFVEEGRQKTGCAAASTAPEYSINKVLQTPALS